MTSAACRGLIVLVFDTLRTDFQRLCAPARLESFARLFAMTESLPHLVCGSFPTVPMRTDLLTGELSFLSRRWARPLPRQRVLTDAMRERDVKTFFVSDTYMLFVPELGFDMRSYFDDARVIRGRGSDPFAPPLSHFDVRLEGRPTRSRPFDKQYLANLCATRVRPLSERFFDDSSTALARALECDRFFLWVDCFAMHEPWIAAPALAAGIEDDEPLWPPYGDASQLTPRQIAGMQRRYAEAIIDTDAAMSRFTESVEEAMDDGDVALAIISDHGFYLGEFGLIGKPKDQPLLPPIFELIGRMSPHLSAHLQPHSAFVQPHDLTAILARAMGAEWSDRRRTEAHRLAGRNSPEVRTLTLLSPDGIAVLWRNDAQFEPAWVRWDELAEERPWKAQGLRTLGCEFAVEMPADAPWLRQFSRQLSALRPNC